MRSLLSGAVVGPKYLMLGRFKRVVVYYNVWEPPPSNATRLLFMEQILLPQLEYDVMLQSAQWRGLEVECVARMDLVRMLAECFALEVEVRGETGHADLQALDTRIRVRVFFFWVALF